MPVQFFQFQEGLGQPWQNTGTNLVFFLWIYLQKSFGGNLRVKKGAPETPNCYNLLLAIKVLLGFI